MKWLVPGAALVIAGFAGHASANPLKSQYTTIDLKTDCRVTRKHQDGNTWSCKGLDGWPISIAEGDLRFFVSVGKGAEKRRAATQTIPQFNSIFKGESNRATMEWRIRSVGGKSVPHATILRYYWSTDGMKGQQLVVMKVTPNETCHAAHINAAMPDALALARKVADEDTRTFDCKGEPVAHGAKQ